MPNAYDIAYRAGLRLTWPIWATRRRTREKVRDALATRTGAAPIRNGSEPAVLIHAVSVGELNAARGLIERLQVDRPGVHVIVTTTTTAGHELAMKTYGARDAMTVVRFPLDFSASINRLLDAVRPTAAVLMELEVWPNFLRLCESRRIPVMVANGRMTAPSFRKYRFIGGLARKMFRRLTWCLVQDEVYATRFVDLGVPSERLVVAGTMKFDTATIGDTVPGAVELARDVDLPLLFADGWRSPLPKPRVLVAGSTGPGEEQIVLDVYARLLRTNPSLRLAIIPRKPERFDEVARLIESRGYKCNRRSTPTNVTKTSARPIVVLGDTMGELRKFYALADVVFVGRTLVDLGSKQHGSDMIEPCALAKPTVVGPFTGNFEEPMRAFRSKRAIAEVADADGLFNQLSAWLSDPDQGIELGRRAQQVVIAGKGAVQRHLQLLLPLLG